MSILIPVFVGFLSGILVASLGGGSNLFMAPIITYLIGRISPVVNGTIALVGCVITIVITWIYSRNGYLCDIFFVLLLFLSAAFGSWFGVKLTYKIKRYYIYATAVGVIFLMAARQIFRLAKHSLSNGAINVISDFTRSIFAGVMTNMPGVYTVLCMFAVILMAIFYEEFLQKISDKRKQTKGITKQ
jgi:uncharacterized membrane protein YfcA